MQDKFHLSLEENLFLAKKLLVENIYNTAKLEGVNTTFPETEAILGGVNVPNAKLDDIQVILNLRDAWRGVLSDIETSTIDLAFIKKINENISRNESLAWGELRSGAIGISGTNHRPKIPDEMEVEQSVDKILSDTDKSVTEKAIDLALYVMYNQIFWDGNKRTANLAANSVLMQNGAGILSISTDNIAEFNRLLKQYYDTGNSASLKNFLYSTSIVDFSTKNDTVNDTVSSTERAVLDVIKNNTSATYEDIEATVGKSRKTVARAIARLKEKGLISRIGSDKTGRWVV